MPRMKFTLILLLFCSCSVIERKVYSPTQINNPSLQEKNDHSFSITYSTPSGFDLNGGWAVTNRLALIGGGYFYKNKDNEEDNEILSSRRAKSLLLYKHKGFHGGLGLYIPLSKKNHETYASFFGGYTYGSFSMNENHTVYDINSSSLPVSTISFYKSNIGRWFLQGGFNFYGKSFEVSFLTRYNYVDYSHIVTDYTDFEQYSYNLPPYGSSPSQFMDFALDSKIFFSDKHRFALDLFLSGTSRLNRKDFDSYYYPFRLGIGMVMRNPFKN